MTPDSTGIKMETDKQIVRDNVVTDALDRCNVTRQDSMGSQFDTVIGSAEQYSRLREIYGYLPENATDREQVYRFGKGTIYFIDTQKINYHLDIFADRVRKSTAGLCISRQCPQLIRDRHQLGKIPILWLSNVDSGEETVIKPSQITSLMTVVTEFIRNSNNGTIILDGMEYLIARNSFEKMLNFVQYLNDRIMVSDCSAMFCVDSKTLNEKQLHLLLSEMTEFPDKSRL